MSAEHDTANRCHKVTVKIAFTDINSVDINIHTRQLQLLNRVHSTNNKQKTFQLEAQTIVYIKGELNLYNKWQSDDLFHIVINENHPRGNRF